MKNVKKLNTRQDGARNFVESLVAIDKAAVELDKLAGEYLQFVK